MKKLTLTVTVLLLTSAIADASFFPRRVTAVTTTVPAKPAAAAPVVPAPMPGPGTATKPAGEVTVTKVYKGFHPLVRLSVFAR